jgi:hypothetical protein
MKTFVKTLSFLTPTKQKMLLEKYQPLSAGFCALVVQPACQQFRELHLFICLVNLCGCGNFIHPDRAV